MRFRHRVIPPDQPPLDEAGDVMLPDDLAALGDRLRCDADMLSSHYPARSTEENMGRQATCLDGKPANSRRYWFATAAVAALLLTVAAWPVVNRLSQQPVNTHRLVIESSSESSPPRNVEGDRLPEASANSVGVTNMDVQPVDYHGGKRSIESTPAVFLQDVSGPELEGLLDLWEQEQSAASGVSI